MQRRGDEPRVHDIRAGAACHHAAPARDHVRARRRPGPPQQDRQADRRRDGHRGVLHLPEAPGRLAGAVRERGPQPGRRARGAHEPRRGPGRALRRAQHHRQRARGLEPSRLLLPARDGRGDLSFAARGSDPALGPGARRARGAEPRAEGILRRGRRGAAGDRHGRRRASRDGRRGRCRHRHGARQSALRRDPGRAHLRRRGARPHRAARAAHRRHQADGGGSGRGARAPRRGDRHA